MAFTNQNTASLVDLVTKVDAFLVANGWVQDEAPVTDRWAIHKTGAGFDIYISARWDSGTPQNLGLYQALGHSLATDPGNHPDDSGMGQISGTNATLDDGRYVRVSNTPVQFWGFEDDHYAHFVVQETATRYVHFGFGLLDKFGDNWTGGEYCYGQYDSTRSIQGGQGARVDFKSFLLDGRATWHNNQTFGIVTELTLKNALPTIHVEGLGIGTASKWAVVAGARHPFSGTVENDRGGTQRNRAFGGYRDGSGASAFGVFSGQSTDGLIPLYQIPIYFTGGATGAGGEKMLLGSMKDVRGANIGPFVPGQEVDVGGETWVMFPAEDKNFAQGGHMGVAYRKVV